MDRRIFGLESEYGVTYMSYAQVSGGAGAGVLADFWQKVL